MESGSPAFPLFLPLNLKSGFRDYFLDALKFGRYPLFDDTDEFVFRVFMAANKEGLLEKFGKERYDEFTANYEEMFRTQWEWKRTPMGEHMARHWLRTGKISGKQSKRLKHHPEVLYAHAELAGYWHNLKAIWNFASDENYRRSLKLRTLEKMVESGKITPEKAKGLEASLDYFRHLPFSFFPKSAYEFCTDGQAFLGGLCNAKRFVADSGYREDVAKNYIERRINSWLARKRISAEEAERLRECLQEEGIRGYLGDFAVHLGMAGFIRFVPLDIAAAAVAAAYFENPLITAAAYLFTSPAIRTAYTLPKMLFFNREKNPYGVALGFGMLPTAGNFAYPLQMCAANKETVFLIKDTASRLGRHVPIWGGLDSGVEHYFIEKASDFTSFVERTAAALPGMKRSLVSSIKNTAADFIRYYTFPQNW